MSVSSDVKPHSVHRLYKAGSWEGLTSIVCNKCGIDKDNAEYNVYRYTCKTCVGTQVRAKAPKQDANSTRLYKNGVWPSLSSIVCSKCNEDKSKTEYKTNRYVCTSCSKEQMRDLNKRKEGGRYNDLQKQYNARYEASAHGRDRRKEYREKLKIVGEPLPIPK